MLPQLAKPLPGTVLDPLYPDEDGRPMGDTDYHSAALIWLRQALEDFFAPVRDVYIATNLILYYEHGNPKSRRDPDVLVARGVVGKHMRRSFRIWEEGVLPRVLFEIISRKTWRVDMGEKRLLYARLGIEEYFVFDPEARYIDPALQGFHSRRGRPVAMKPARDGSLRSRELGLRMVPEGGMLRLYDLKNGEPVLTREERADKLAAQVAALQEELSRRRNDRK